MSDLESLRKKIAEEEARLARVDLASVESTSSPTERWGLRAGWFEFIEVARPI